MIITNDNYNKYLSLIIYNYINKKTKNKSKKKIKKNKKNKEIVI